jgi:NADPH-dependent 2,4-dienoyl-CoA reductase/sulfur reductase-like enzyme
MSQPEQIVVVGASLAGLRGIEALRQEGFEGRIVAVGAEPHLPYDRPPLSKQFLRGDWDEDRLALRRDGVEDLDVDWRLGTPTTAC